MSPASQAAIEATAILRNVAKLRRATRPIKPKSSLRLVSADELMDGENLARGEPGSEDKLDEIYAKACHFWAKAIARQLTGPEWNEMVEAACAEVPNFPGEPIRFFENLFHGMKLADGTLIIP